MVNSAPESVTTEVMRSAKIDAQTSGDFVEEAIPDPIPNSEVKLFRADGTAWATVWESRTSPGYLAK